MNLTLTTLLALMGSISAIDPLEKFVDDAPRQLGLIAAMSTPDARTDAIVELFKDLAKVQPNWIDAKAANTIVEQIGEYMKNEKNSSDQRRDLLKAASKPIGYFLDFITLPTGLSKLIKEDSEMVNTMLVVFKTRTSKKLVKVPAEFIMAGGVRMVEELQVHTKDSPSILHEAPAEFWSLLNKADEELMKQMCAVIRPSTILRLKDANFRQFKSGCFANIPGIASEKELKIRSFPKEIFEGYNGVVGSAVALKMTGDQLANFGHKDVERRCVNLPLHHVNKEAIKSLTLPCLLSYFSSPIKGELGDRWKSIPASIFEPFSALQKEVIEMFAGKFGEKDMKFVSVEILNQLLSAPAFISKLKPFNIKSNKVGIKFDSKHLAMLKNSDLVSIIILSNNVSDDIFKYTGSAFFNGLEVVKGGKTYSGLKVLDAMSGNKASIIANLSKEIKESEHACKSIKSYEEFNSIDSFKTNVPPAKCIKHLQADVPKKHAKARPALLKKISYQEVAKKYSKDGFAQMTREMLANVVAGEFCAYVGEKEFNSINEDALPAIDSRCVNLLAGRFPLDPKKIARFSDDAFKNLFAARLENIPLAHITDKQLPYVSMDAGKDGVFAAFTPSEVQRLGSRAKLLNATQISMCPNVALAAFSASNLRAGSLSLLSPAQIEAMAPLYGKLTAQQVKDIGAQHADKLGVEKVLVKNQSKFSEEARSALELRYKPTKDGASIANPSAVLIIAAVVVTMLL